eukprot:m.221170 g.221170  ORF g.221170 m.221170 type:complete len:446 (-) comp10532_c0_seq1:312-1649(-)
MSTHDSQESQSEDERGLDIASGDEKKDELQDRSPEATEPIPSRTPAEPERKLPQASRGDKPPEVPSGDSQELCRVCNDVIGEAKSDSARKKHPADCCTNCYMGLWRDVQRVLQRRPRVDLSNPTQAPMSLEEFAKEALNVGKSCLRLKPGGECPLRAQDLIAIMDARRAENTKASLQLRMERCTRCRTQATVRIMPNLTLRLLSKASRAKMEGSGSSAAGAKREHESASDLSHLREKISRTASTSRQTAAPHPLPGGGGAQNVRHGWQVPPMFLGSALGNGNMRLVPATAAPNYNAWPMTTFPSMQRMVGPSGAYGIMPADSSGAYYNPMGLPWAFAPGYGATISQAPSGPASSSSASAVVTSAQIGEDSVVPGYPQSAAFFSGPPRLVPAGMQMQMPTMQLVQAPGMPGQYYMCYPGPGQVQGAFRAPGKTAPPTAAVAAVQSP